MNYNNYLQDKQYFRDKINRLEYKKDLSEKNNKIHEKTKQEYITLLSSLEEIDNIYKMLNNLKDCLNTEYVEFKNRRVNYLADLISDTLFKIFPDERFKSKIIYTDKRRAVKPVLYLEDNLGQLRKPSVTEGKLCQYLISYAAVIAITGINSCNKLFIDEAFGVASENNRPKIGKMIESLVSTGYQLILISQNSDLFCDIQRREIHMEIDKNRKAVVVTDVIDF